ncbi:MAG: glutamine amidotransferase [Spirochaetes bacterium]|nr:glutamine amidotransferase [Spirochaetota bacterium]
MKKIILNIGYLYPTLMNLYGDRGNVTALSYRASLRGIETNVIPLRPGDKIPKKKIHVFFMGGGQDKEQTLIYKDFINLKGKILKDEIESGTAFLAVCGGYQLLGHSYEVFNGEKIKGIGALDVYTEAGKNRSIGNILIDADLYGKKFEVIGFENHGGRTFLGKTVKPLGKVIIGGGNNASDGTEGAVYKNTIATYLHGPILPKNPLLTDFLIERGLSNYNKGFTLDSVKILKNEKNTVKKPVVSLPVSSAFSSIEEIAFSSVREIIVSEKNKKRELFKRN